MLVDLDVIIDAGSAFLPFGVDIGLGGQGGEGRPVELLEQLTPAGAEMTGHAAVQLIQEFVDGLVQFDEREEAALAEPCQNPSLDDLDADLDLGLVARLVGRAGITAVA